MKLLNFPTNSIVNAKGKNTEIEKEWFTLHTDAEIIIGNPLKRSIMNARNLNIGKT